MKFKIKVRNCYTSWEEEYVENISEKDIDIFSSDLIANFNRTLRPGEEPREYLGYTVLDNAIKHEWEKVNPYTLFDRNKRQYDKFKCKNCGVTGKRYTLGGEIVLDREYGAKKYRYCNWKISKE